jgi:hypothetical protein
MLAIAGAVTWFGYLVMTYGISQLNGQNYSFKQLAVPGLFTLGNPAPDPPRSDPCAGKTNPVDGSYAWEVVSGKCVKIPKVPGGPSGNCADGSTPNPKTGKCKDGSTSLGWSVARGGR